MVAVIYERRTLGHATRERRQHMHRRNPGVRSVSCCMARPPMSFVSTRSCERPRRRTAIGISSIRHWHRTNRLPRFHRACPSTALDERCQVGASVAGVSHRVKTRLSRCRLTTGHLPCAPDHRGRRVLSVVSCTHAHVFGTSPRGRFRHEVAWSRLPVVCGSRVPGISGGARGRGCTALASWHNVIGECCALHGRGVDHNPHALCKG